MIADPFLASVSSIAPNWAPQSPEWPYDGIDLIAVYDDANLLTRRYVHGLGVDDPIVWYEGNGTSDRRWLHADERGSIIAASDLGGAAIGINSYDGREAERA